MAEPLSTPAYARLRDRLRADILAGAWPPGTHRTLGALAASEARGETTSDVSDSDGLSITSEHERATSPCLRPTLKCRQT